MASDIEADTVALNEQYLSTLRIHHRDFQQYSVENEIYLAPIDEDETERLQVQHEVLRRVFDNRLIFPPVTNPRRILDLGYGSASWALEVADQYEHCEVVGLDISPHMKPEETPENLYLQLDDLNQRFTFPSNTFDLVHSQFLATGIKKDRWAGYVRDMHRVTKPGGWCQMAELYFQAQSDNNTLTEQHALRQWSTRFFESLSDLKDLRAPLRLPNLMRAAGFKDIEHKMIQLPTCGWSTHPREHDIGVVNRENVQRWLSSLAIYPMTQILGMSFEDVLLLVAHARNEASQPAFKAYFPLYVCIGRKSRR